MASKKLEQSYPRDTYAVTLRGRGIFEFKNTYEARKKEIMRCKNIKNVKAADLVREKQLNEIDMTNEELLNKVNNISDERRDIVIEVSTYDDLCTIMQPWPHDAFYKGVKPYINGIELLPITIKEVETSVIIRENSIAMKNLAETME